jgi:uncharacterized protein
MHPASDATFTGFVGDRRIAHGRLSAVAASVKAALDSGEAGDVAIFDDDSARPVELDFRGSASAVEQSAEQALAALRAGELAPRGPGRPKLGVVAREVTLLPRHWNWLAEQPGGASAALRKLVEEASRDKSGRDRRRRAREATYRFLSAMAGNRPHFEDAARALFAGDKQKFIHLAQAWPGDIADHARFLSKDAFDERP